MRRTLIVLLLLLALTAAVFAVVPAAVDSRQGDVRVDEVRIAGDPSAAEGLFVQTDVSSGGHLHWSTTVTFGQEAAAESEFRFTTRWESHFGHAVPHLDIQSQLGGGYGGSGSDLQAENFRPLNRMVQTAMDATAPGEVHTETLRIADYFAFCPLTVSASRAYLDGSYEVYNNEGLSGSVYWSRVSEFFRLPVGDEATAQITISKDALGSVYDIRIETSDLAVFFLQSAAVYCSDGDAYLAVSCWDEESEPLLLDNPAVQGIYYVPIVDRREVDFRVDTDNIRQVWPGVEGGAVTNLYFSGDESRLLARVVEDDEAWMIVLDEATMQELQRIPLGPDESAWGCWVWDDELATVDNDRILRFWHWEDGQYQARIEAQLPEEFEDFYNMSFCYDGTRLLLARNVENCPCSMQVAVCGEEGLLYAATLSHSLDWFPPTYPDDDPTAGFQE